MPSSNRPNRKSKPGICPALVCLVLVGWVVPPAAAQIWHNDVEAAKQLAAARDQVVVLHFWAPWCQPCGNLDRFVFSHPSVQQVLSSEVVAVKVNVDTRPDLARQYAIGSIPADVAIAPDGSQLAKRPSPKTVDAYIQMLKNVSASTKTVKPNVAKLIEQSNRAFGQQIDSQSLRQQATMPPYARLSKPTSDTAPADTRRASYPGGGSFPVAAPSHPAPSHTAPSHAAPTHPAPTHSLPELGAPTHVFQQPEVVEGLGGGLVGGTHMPPGTHGSPNLQTAYSTRDQANHVADSIASDSPGPLPRRDRSTPGQLQVNPHADSVAPEPITPEPITPDSVGAGTGLPPRSTDAAIENSFTSRPASESAPPLGLEGYCPVTLISQEQWVPGDRRWGCIHRGKLYLFNSQQNRDLFRMAPDAYSPLLAGFDPVTFKQSGHLVEGRRELGAFFGGDNGPKIVVLFETPQHRQQFEANPVEFIQNVRRVMNQIDR